MSYQGKLLWAFRLALFSSIDNSIAPFSRSFIVIKRFIVEGILYLANHGVNRLPSHRVRLWFYRHILGFKIGRGSFVLMQTCFDARKNYHMGNNSVINPKCRIDTRGRVSIGDNVSISAEVCILTADHDLQCPDFTGRERPVVIEDYVFIGTRAMVLPGITIGKGAAVAAGAIVTHDVLPFTIVAGVPAKPIGTRCRDLTYTLHYDRLLN